MANYLFINETLNKKVYVKDIGSYLLDVDKVIDFVYEKNKWAENDKIMFIILGENAVSYDIKGNKIDLYKYDDYIEINVDASEVNDIDGTYSDYDYDEVYDDRYDERDEDCYSNGYEDECYECCDIY